MRTDPPQGSPLCPGCPDTLARGDRCQAKATRATSACTLLIKGQVLNMRYVTIATNYQGISWWRLLQVSALFPTAITGCCAAAPPPPPYKQLLASFPTEAIGMGSHCLLPALLNLPVLPSCHGPAGQPRPDPHRLGDTGVQNNNSENSFFSQIEERMGFPMSPSPSENCISPGLQQHTEHNT